MSSRCRIVAVWMIMLAMVAACAAQPTPTPVPPTPTLAPTRTPVPPTATPEPTAVPAVPTTVDFEVTSNIIYAEVDAWRTRLDVYAPSPQGPWPVVVAVHGGFAGRSRLEPLVEAIASQGAVVYNVDVKHTKPLLTSAVERIACAVRYARDTAADYGGDLGWIALVGHSAGGWGAAVIALAGDDFGADCAVTDESSLVDALVTYEGDYDATTVYPDFTRIKDKDPELWHALNPHSHIGRNPELRVRLIHGDAEDLPEYDVPLEVAIEFHQALAEAGYDVELTVVEGAGHGIDSDVMAVMVEQVMELARTGAAHAPSCAASSATGAS